MSVNPSPSRCNRDTSPKRGFFLISFTVVFFVSFLLFLLSQKKKQEKPDGKRKKKKGCSRSSRSRELLSKLKIPPLATDCFPSPSANPTVPDLLVSLDGGRRSFVLYAPRVLQKLLVDSSCSFTTRRENCNDCQHIGGVICSLIAMRVAVIACGWRTTSGRLYIIIVSSAG